MTCRASFYSVRSICRTGVYSRRLIDLNFMLRREQAPALRYPIITQIGRENNSSAEIYMCIRRGDLRSPAGERSSPLPCSENILMGGSVSRAFLFMILSSLLDIERAVDCFKQDHAHKLVRKGQL